MIRHFWITPKKRRKARADHRKINRKLLEALNRNIGHINALLDIFLAKGRPFPLSRREQKMFWVVQTVYQQQKQMYDKNSNRCDHRIVSIFQPHVRPMVRGKDKAKVEFGSKLGASLDNGFARIDTLSWDAYNESGDLVLQVENYRELHGHWPELVQADKIYAARANRAYLKERGIRITAPPLGRKSKALQQESHYKRRKRKKEATERNHIEGKFGQGKNGYGLNKIRARLRDTSESWVAAIFFVMNLVHYRKNVFSWLCCTIKTVMDCPADHLKDFLGIISSMATIPNQNERKSLTKVAL